MLRDWDWDLRNCCLNGCSSLRLLQLVPGYDREVIRLLSIEILKLLFTKKKKKKKKKHQKEIQDTETEKRS